MKIKIPYTYTSYPNCPEATRLSQKMARRKARGDKIVFIMMGGILIGCMFGLEISKLSMQWRYILAPLCVIFGGWVGWYLDHRINLWYEKQIRDLLEIANKPPLFYLDRNL